MSKCFRCGCREIGGICQNYGCEGNYTSPRQVIDKKTRKLLRLGKLKAKAVPNSHLLQTRHENKVVK